MRIKIPVLLLFSFLCGIAQSQNHSLVGYWQNWNDSQCPYFPITQTNELYNVIAIAFATPVMNSTYNMQFVPETAQPTFISQIDSLKQRGKKVIISIGGQNHPISLNDTNERNIFVNSMMNIINTYKLDGLDIDIEGQFSISGGTIANPIDARIINMINAVKMMMTNFRTLYNKKMFLTMAPETANVTGGMSGYGSIWGSYLPLIYALKDSIDILHMQLYNSGSMYGIDGRIYNQGTSDFITSQTEAIIHGFNTSGGNFPGLRQDQVAVGLPACSSAAGGGYIHPDTVKAAINYLRGVGPKPSTYTKVGTYANLRGMMTWSINWDRVNTCHPSYQYAINYSTIFPISNNVEETGTTILNNFILNQNYPNPFNPETKISYTIFKSGNVKISLYNMSGQLISVLKNGNQSAGYFEIAINGNNLPSGNYIYEMIYDGNKVSKMMTLIK